MTHECHEHLRTSQATLKSDAELLLPFDSPLTMPEVRTFTYSPESGPRSPAIHLDVHLPSGPSSSRTVVWFHGGGLLQGTRKNIAPHMLAAVEKEQIVLISVDYRHAPQVRLPDIQSDVARAFNYIVHTLPRLLEAKVNVESVVVTGSSAGGWLALMLALGMVESAGVKEEDRRRIKAVGAIYPITDAGAAWWDGPRSPMIKPLWPDESECVRVGVSEDTSLTITMSSTPVYEKMSDPDLPAESNTEGTPQTNPRVSRGRGAGHTFSTRWLTRRPTRRRNFITTRNSRACSARCCSPHRSSNPPGWRNPPWRNSSRATPPNEPRRGPTST